MPLELVAQLPALGKERGVRRRQAHERDIQRAAGRVETQCSASCLRPHPRLKVADRLSDLSAGVEAAIHAIGRDRVHQVHLGSGEVVRAVAGGSFGGRRRRREQQCEDRRQNGGGAHGAAGYYPHLNTGIAREGSVAAQLPGTQ